MITREQALELLTDNTPDTHLMNHALETEAVLRGLALELDEDPDLWGLTGLLHDLDYAKTQDSPERHGLVAADELQGMLPGQALQAIRAHNGERNNTPPQSRLDFALRCGESVTGLVSASALVRPQGMQGMKAKSLKKKMKDKSFAAKVNRENIRECEHLGLDLTRFLDIAVSSMTPIAEQVGLSRE